MVRALIATMLPTLVFVTGCDKNITDKDIVDISTSEVVRLVSQVKTKPELVLVIDPRRPQEFQAGHIPGAANLQIDEFASQANRQGRLPVYEKYDMIVVYGDDPASTVARAMTKRLLANNYDEVYWFKGGLQEWVANGGELGKSK